MLIQNIDHMYYDKTLLLYLRLLIFASSALVILRELIANSMF